MLIRIQKHKRKIGLLMILVKGGKAGFIQKEPWQLGEEVFGGSEGMRETGPNSSSARWSKGVLTTVAGWGS